VPSVTRRVIARLSYANVMATLAVFLVLGGGAYAAATLPAHSVGKRQLRKGAVTRPKLAPRSVHTAKLAPDAVAARKLSPGVRARLARVGPAGPAGARGPAGPAGPGAARIAFAAAATAAPQPVTLLDIAGLRIEGRCATAGGTVSLPLRITAAEASQAQETIVIDTGTDPATSGATQVGNLQFDLTAGAPLDTGGPAASGADYFRVVATFIVAAPSRTITVNAVVLVDAETQRCTMSGTAVSAT